MHKKSSNPANLEPIYRTQDCRDAHELLLSTLRHWTRDASISVPKQHLGPARLRRVTVRGTESHLRGRNLRSFYTWACRAITTDFHFVGLAVRRGRYSRRLRHQQDQRLQLPNHEHSRTISRGTPMQICLCPRYLSALHAIKSLPDDWSRQAGASGSLAWANKGNRG